MPHPTHYQRPDDRLEHGAAVVGGEMEWEGYLQADVQVVVVKIAGDGLGHCVVSSPTDAVLVVDAEVVGIVNKQRHRRQEVQVEADGWGECHAR